MEIDLWRTNKRGSDDENDDTVATTRRMCCRSISIAAEEDVISFKWLEAHNLPQQANSYCHTFAELKVHEERAFSRSSPNTALDQLASSLGLGSASSSAAASSPWVAAAAAVMAACGAHDCDSVSSSLLEVDTPRFATSWAAKWANGAGRLRLVHLQIYNGSRPCVLRASSVYNLGCAPTTTVAPEHTVFMPLL